MRTPQTLEPEPVSTGVGKSGYPGRRTPRRPGTLLHHEEDVLVHHDHLCPSRRASPPGTDLARRVLERHDASPTPRAPTRRRRRRPSRSDARLFPSTRRSEAFTADTGYVSCSSPRGRRGARQPLVLTKDNPPGRCLRRRQHLRLARGRRAYSPYASQAPAATDAAAYAPLDDTLTAVDYSDVCLNIDDGWFAEAGITRRVTLADLTERPDGRLGCRDAHRASPSCSRPSRTGATAGRTTGAPVDNGVGRPRLVGRLLPTSP